VTNAVVFWFLFGWLPEFGRKNEADSKMFSGRAADWTEVAHVDSRVADQRHSLTLLRS
jgi:hypothetical protein